VAAHLHAGLRLRGFGREGDRIWRGLLAGWWGVVEHFDAHGRRFIIARRRLPRASRPSLGRLSDRERAACAQAALGHSNKVIACELGVAVSTAGMLLLRAMRKLRCDSREQLIQIFRSGEGRWADEPNPDDDAPARRVP
jgi:DNA-binding CsgD family transcriptional regulator